MSPTLESLNFGLNVHLTFTSLAGAWGEGGGRTQAWQWAVLACQRGSGGGLWGWGDARVEAEASRGGSLAGRGALGKVPLGAGDRPELRVLRWDQWGWAAQGCWGQAVVKTLQNQVTVCVAAALSRHGC